VQARDSYPIEAILKMALLSSFFDRGSPSPNEIWQFAMLAGLIDARAVYCPRSHNKIQDMQT